MTKTDRLNLSETAANEKTAEEETEETAANEKTAEEETPTSHSVAAAAPTPTPAPTVATPTLAPTSSHQSPSPAVSNCDRLQLLKEKVRQQFVGSPAPLRKPVVGSPAPLRFLNPLQQEEEDEVLEFLQASPPLDAMHAMDINQVA